MSGSKPTGKSFDIGKVLVWEAWEKVKANRGAAGVDGVSVEEFEADLKNNLYKVWNRMSSGTYFPPPVQAVQIPKPDGGVRVLGVPTVADRVAQTVVTMVLEPWVDPVFHEDSYGYRPGRSALDAVGVARRRCWRYDWVVDLDIKAFFDTVPHDLIIKAVAKHTDLAWVRLYVKRWLVAPVQQPDGSLVQRDRGTPQGSAISPLLANLFMHYAFDTWMVRQMPTVPFERYCDDVVVHCVSEKQAIWVREAITGRLAELGLTVHPEKTKIVYCKDDKRRGRYAHTSFTFLGYDFRVRRARDKQGGNFYGFLPAVSRKAQKSMASVIRSWNLGRRSDLSMRDLAQWINPIVAGWITYYGRFYKSELVTFLQRINRKLVLWLRRKYRRLGKGRSRARALLARAAATFRGMFAHWRFGARPDGWTTGAV